ncbi:DUF1353 domain-containing protein [Campylobacter sp. faydin G-24]|uniref:DUF1353 domain-containing protein n=1 Tax=Campylobacter anatolicus TaxID=2829105 RepID=A0ABS5HJM6_9BACT|nr:DUF1353 domain-containing protein [Campylobacter anatolicus]MBR8464266.1 DUF1353 domain-containing protein [Campylobacter anatolicus]
MNEVKISRPLLKPFDKDKFELVQIYTYKDITIPAGYKTNGANIPRIFWSVLPPNSPEYLSAVIVHDYLCDKEEYKKADEILKQMMIALEVTKWKVYAFYYGCRIYHRIKYAK